MPYPPRRFSPSLESNASVGPSTNARPSLFDSKDEFIERVSPIGMAAIYFGSFSFTPQDAALSRQALFKLSFAYRYFLQPAGLKIGVQRHTAILSGKLGDRYLVMMADLLARQIEGIQEVENELETKGEPAGKGHELEAARDAAQLLFATDQTLRAGMQVNLEEGQLFVDGEVKSQAEKAWAELLVGSVADAFESRLKAPHIPGPVDAVKPPDVDDESLQALILLRLRLIPETEHLTVKVKANRGVVSLQGKVRTEALRQRVENLTRSTLGLRELRSTLTLIP